VSEIWKDVVGYKGLYQVSSLGRVKRIGRGKGAQAGRILRPMRDGAGYFQVVLYRGGKRTAKMVHRLVLEAHVGPAPEGCEVNHRNGAKTDNCVENLEWVTRSENMRHAYDVLGFESACGEAHGSAKNTREDVLEIRRLAATGELTQAELGKMFGVDRTTISLIVRRETWQHLP